MEIALILIVVAGGLFILARPAAALSAGAQSSAAVNETLARCAALQEELATLRVQGGDVSEQEKVAAQLRQCARTAEAAGASIDEVGLTLESVRTIENQINTEFAHYRSTDYSDGVKRKNTLNTVWRLGERAIRELETALANATTSVDCERIRDAMRDIAVASFERVTCFDQSEEGCGRFGVNESAWHERAQNELQRILLPIIGTLKSDDPRWKEASKKGVWYRARPHTERIGIKGAYPWDTSGAWLPRISRRGPDYSGITGDIARSMNNAAKKDLWGQVEKRCSEIEASEQTNDSQDSDA